MPVDRKIRVKLNAKVFHADVSSCIPLTSYWIGIDVGNYSTIV